MPGNNATMAVSATGATAYQWRFNGSDIISATNSTLVVTNAQTTNIGYYVAIAKNSIGWVPGQLTYIAVVGQPGIVPLSNLANSDYTGGQALSQITEEPIDDGIAQVVAGPELDQMQLVQNSDEYETPVTNGYFDLENSVGPIFIDSVPVSTVSPGQTVYYSVYITYDGYTQPSTVMKLVAGANDASEPSNYGLYFPIFIEWPDDPTWVNTATSQVIVPGETISLTNAFFAYPGPPLGGLPTVQWRKDGQPMIGQTNSLLQPSQPIGYGGTYDAVLTITNFEATNSGVYDVEVFGNNWIVSPKINLSVQTANGQGIFQNPYFNQTNFVCTLLGAPGRNYQLQVSSNLVNWVNSATLMNVAGTVTFTNSSPPGSVQFYRTLLLP